MRSGKQALAVAFSLAMIALAAAPAHAQQWFGRPFVGWRGNPWMRFAGAGQLGGGEIVGSSEFAVGGQPTATFTAAQWQDLVTAQARQTPMMSAAQWQQLVTAQARQTQPLSLSPAQRLTLMRAAAVQQQQQQNAAFAEALRKLQEQLNPPPPNQ
jgi:hypothetical protein